MNFQEIASNLQYTSGIWYSREKNTISYPESGNQNSFQIEEDSPWFQHRNSCIAALVKKFSPNETIFDIGGGNGIVSIGLEREGINTVLVEPGEAGILNAQKRNLKNLICSTLNDAAFMPDSIPSIGLFDVLEHVEDDHAFLKNLNNLLVPNGKIYISVPAYSFLWSNEDDLGGHYRRYTLDLLEKKLKQTGFRLLYKTYIFCVLPIPIFLMRSVPSRLGLAKNSIVVSDQKQVHSSISILNKVHQWELRRIQKWKTIPFGGSCLLAAHKISEKSETPFPAFS